MSNKWFKIEGKDFYTPFKQEKTEYFHLDNKVPTPGEIVDTINSNKECMYMGDGFFERTIEISKDAEVELPPGIYRYKPASGGEREGLLSFQLREDEYIPLGDFFEKVKSDLRTFFEAKNSYEQLGTLYKLGILLYGLPGNGKTTIIRHIINEVLPKESVIVFIAGDLPSFEFNRTLKETLHNRLKVFIFEELTTNINRHNYVADLLNFLDGEESLHNQLVIATTNYPENLPGNVVNRHSRFDKLYEFAPPSTDARIKLLTRYLDREPSPEEISKTKDKSIADIKEIVIRMKIGNQTFLEALKDISDRESRSKRAFAKPTNIGFNNDDW